MRDITKVIDRMLEHIPGTDHELRHRLRKIKDSANFTAPEAMRGRWMELQTLLGSFFGQGDLPAWGHTVGRILSDKE